MNVDLDKLIKSYEDSKEYWLRELEGYLITYDEIPKTVKAQLAKSFLILRELNGLKHGMCEKCGNPKNIKTIYCEHKDL